MKNLETEYRDAISLEVPDLWSRIEAGVDEYEAGKVNKTVTNIEEIKTKDTDNDSNEDIVIQKIRRKQFTAKAVRVLSAVACLALAVGVINVIGNKSSNESATMSDSVMYEAATETQSYDEAPAAAADMAAAESEESFNEDYDSIADSTNHYAIANEGMTDDRKAKSDTMLTAEAAITDTQIRDSLAEMIGCSTKEAEVILLQLKVAGIDKPSEIVREEETAKKEELEGEADTSAQLIRITFTDEATKDKYVMVISSDDKAILEEVIKVTEGEEVIYKKED